MENFPKVSTHADWTKILPRRIHTIMYSIKVSVDNGTLNYYTLSHIKMLCSFRSLLLRGACSFWMTPCCWALLYLLNTQSVNFRLVRCNLHFCSIAFHETWIVHSWKSTRQINGGCIMSTRYKNNNSETSHSDNDVIQWKYFPRHSSFVRGIHQSRWIPLTKASNAEFWCFLWSAPEQTVEQIIETPVIWDTVAPIMMSQLCKRSLLIMEISHNAVLFYNGNSCPN